MFVFCAELVDAFTHVISRRSAQFVSKFREQLDSGAHVRPSLEISIMQLTQPFQHRRGAILSAEEDDVCPWHSGSENIAKSRDAIKILDGMIGNNRAAQAQAAEAELNARVAQLIYDVRNRARLTQSELAALVGTTQSVISRLEDADYEGHSLSMLQRIATALHVRLEIRFATSPQKLAA